MLQGVDFVVEIRVLLILFKYLLVFNIGLDVSIAFILHLLLLLLLFLLHVNIKRFVFNLIMSMLWCVEVSSVQMGLHLVAHVMSNLREVILRRSKRGCRIPIVLTKMSRLETRLTLRMQNLDVPPTKTSGTLFGS